MLDYSVNSTLVTSVPVCSDPELLGNHSSELNNLPAAGEAGGCGHDSYASVNWKITSQLLILIRLQMVKNWNTFSFLIVY